MSFSRSGAPTPPFSYPVGTGVFTDVLASNTVFSTYFRGDGGFLSNVNSSIPGTLPNLVVSNSLTTTNVFATIYRGDGGLLSNVNSSIPGTLPNLVVSNSLTTTNVFATIYRGDGGLLSNISTYGNTLSNLNASNLAFGVISPGLIYGNLISNINSSNITQPFTNLSVSNTVTTTNLVAAGFTSNSTNTVFNYSTLTVPFVVSTTLNVSGTSNLGATVITSANVSGTSNLGATVITSANVSGTSNLGATVIKSSNTSGTSNMVGAVTVMGGLTTPSTSTSVFNGPLNFNSTFSPGVLAGNIRNILQGSSSVASVTPGPVNGTVTFGGTLTGTSYSIFFQPRYSASQTIFSITANTYTTTTCSYYAYRVTGAGATCSFDWMLIDYNP